MRKHNFQCCPGYVATDMTQHKGPLKVEQGADTPVYLAVDPNPHQAIFVYQRKVTTW